VRSLWGWIVLAVRFELRLYVALLRWVLRRPAVPHGSRAWGYSRQVTPVMWLWIFASGVEIPVAHVVIPWPGLRLLVLGVGVWGLLWMVGFLASLKVYPHLTDADGVRIRHGKQADLAVPWSRVASAVTVDRDLQSSIRTYQPLETPVGVDLQIGVGARTNVHLELVEPLTVEIKDEPVPVTALTFLVDEPKQFVSAVMARSSAAG